MAADDQDILTFPDGEDPMDAYELGDIYTEGEGFTVHRAIEKSVLAPCFIHRMSYHGKALSPRQAHAAANLLRRFGAMTQPRTPRLADAWIAEREVVAVEYRADATPFDLQDNNPFYRGGSIRAADIVQGSLETVAALHICGIIHGRPVLGCWGLAMGNRVHLVDTSLDVTIVNCLEEMSQELNATLSTNLFTRDVACWAFAMISLLLGRELVPESLDEKWDDYYHKQAEDGLQQCVRKEKAREFFRHCLAGFGPMATVYDTGLEAVRAFKAGNIAEALQ